MYLYNLQYICHLCYLKPDKRLYLRYLYLFDCISKFVYKEVVLFGRTLKGFGGLKIGTIKAGIIGGLVVIRCSN